MSHLKKATSLSCPMSEVLRAPKVYFYAVLHDRGTLFPRGYCDCKSQEYHSLTRLSLSISSTEQPRKRQEARGGIAAPSPPCALRSRRALGGPRPWRAPLSRGAAVPLEKGAWHAERLPRAHARMHLRRVDSSSVALPRRGTSRKVSPKRGGWTTDERRMPAGMRQVVVCRLLLGYRWRWL